MLGTTFDTALPWNKLMHSLDTNPQTAGMKYEHIRRRLVSIFRARGHLRCEELADRAIDRVARKLDRGLRLWEGQSQGYFYRVAHYVSLEASREDARARRALKQLHRQCSPLDEAAKLEQHLGILEAHIHSLRDEDHRLLLRYYEGDGQARIQNRRRLALENGMTLNTLRVRVHRIRAELEQALSERPSDS